MASETFPILPARRRAMYFNLAAYAVSAVLAAWIASERAGSAWFWTIWAVVSAGLAGFTLVAVLRRRYVARVDDSGVTVCLMTGRELHAGWAEIEAHTIDPARRIGAVLARGGTKTASGGRVRVLPVSIRMMGPEAAERLIAAMKERLPKLEYRVPSLGAGQNSRAK